MRCAEGARAIVVARAWRWLRGAGVARATANGRTLLSAVPPSEAPVHCGQCHTSAAGMPGRWRQCKWNLRAAVHGRWSGRACVDEAIATSHGGRKQCRGRCCCSGVHLARAWSLHGGGTPPQHGWKQTSSGSRRSRGARRPPRRSHRRRRPPPRSCRPPRRCRRTPRAARTRWTQSRRDPASRWRRP